MEFFLIVEILYNTYISKLLFSYKKNITEIRKSLGNKTHKELIQEDIDN